MRKSQRHFLNRIGTIFIAPILFLVCGYSLIYLIGLPVINFTTSSLSLFLLADTPNFEEKQTKITIKSEQNTQEIASSTLNYPKSGSQYGYVHIEKLKLNEPLYFGDSNEILRKGAGQYTGSVYPGEKGTSLIGGHNVDGFGKIIALQAGDKIELKTVYGTYQYQVTDSQIKRYDDQTILDQVFQREKYQLILYTCYPVDAIGLTDERLFVFADLISGPIINPDK